jgi:hypothetical protein
MHSTSFMEPLASFGSILQREVPGVRSQHAPGDETGNV